MDLSANSKSASPASLAGVAQEGGVLASINDKLADILTELRIANQIQAQAHGFPDDLNQLRNDPTLIS